MSTIKFKNSATSSQAPTAGNLAYGELALNTADQKIFYKNTSDAVKELVGPNMFADLPTSDPSETGRLWNDSGTLKISGSAPASPSYTLSTSSGTVNEGSTVRVTLNTTSVANSTGVDYSITGISSADLSAGSLTGTFTVQNNTAFVDLTLAEDANTEGTEYITFSLDNGEALAIIITVNDTSTTPPPMPPSGSSTQYDVNNYYFYRETADTHPISYVTEVVWDGVQVYFEGSGLSNPTSVTVGGITYNAVTLQSDQYKYSVERVVP